MKCAYEHRVNVHHSVRCGGVKIGQCEKDAVPGLIMCLEHTSKESLHMLIQNLLSDYKKKTGEPHRYESAG